MKAHSQQIQAVLLSVLLTYMHRTCTQKGMTTFCREIDRSYEIIVGNKNFGMIHYIVDV